MYGAGGLLSNFGGTKIIFCNKSFSFKRMRLRSWVANFQKNGVYPGVELGTGEYNREILSRKNSDWSSFVT